MAKILGHDGNDCNYHSFMIGLILLDYKFRSFPFWKYQDKNVKLSTEILERFDLLLLIRKPLILKTFSQQTDQGGVKREGTPWR